MFSLVVELVVRSVEFLQPKIHPTTFTVSIVMKAMQEDGREN